MPLPSAWVDRIFDKLTLTYGHQFLGRWSGLDLDAVKRDWAHELAGFESRPEAIKHALQHLPVNEPPSVRQFVAACISAPLPAAKALPPPKPDAQFVGQIMQRLATAKAESSERLTPAQQCERNIYAAAARYNGGVLTPAQKAMLKSMREAGQIAHEATE